MIKNLLAGNNGDSFIDGSLLNAEGIPTIGAPERQASRTKVDRYWT